MSIATPELIRNCKRCGAELMPGALVCNRCHALVHSEELEQISAEAKALEAKGQLRQAREQWLIALRMLPASSKQASWIEHHARSLDDLADKVQPRVEPSENKWAQRLGPVGPIAVLLAKSKALLAGIFKLKFLFSFAAFFGFYWAAFGMKFGLGFAVLILIHEMGHFIDVKRRGLPADMPFSFPALGPTCVGKLLESRSRPARRSALPGHWPGFWPLSPAPSCGGRRETRCGLPWRALAPL